MTGFDSKRKAALDEEGMYLVHHTKGKTFDRLGNKVHDDDDTQVYGDALTIAYQSGYYDGKKAAQRVQEPDAIGCQCAECGEWQRWTPSGMVCKNGHGGASGINQRLYTTPPAAQPAQEPVAWMVYTQDGQSVYVTDNPTDIQEGQRALPLYTKAQHD
jgi:hypothetical protein